MGVEGLFNDLQAAPKLAASKRKHCICTCCGPKPPSLRAAGLNHYQGSAQLCGVKLVAAGGFGSKVPLELTSHLGREMGRKASGTAPSFPAFSSVQRSSVKVYANSVAGPINPRFGWRRKQQMDVRDTIQTSNLLEPVVTALLDRFAKRPYNPRLVGVSRTAMRFL